MRFVMVPVPREHVLDVMRWVLFRAPEEDGTSDMRDAARLRTICEESDDLTMSLLVRVARATVDGDTPRLTDVADDLGEAPDTIRATLRTLNAWALGGGRDLVKVSNEPAVGVHGNTGKISFLMMRPEHAHFVRRVSAADARSD